LNYLIVFKFYNRHKKTKPFKEIYVKRQYRNEPVPALR